MQQAERSVGFHKRPWTIHTGVSIESSLLGKADSSRRVDWRLVVGERFALAQEADVRWLHGSLCPVADDAFWQWPQALRIVQESEGLVPVLKGEASVSPDKYYKKYTIKSMG